MNNRLHSRLIKIFLILCIYTNTALAQFNDDLNFHNWAHTPPMGWNSWDCFGPSVVESEVKANADYMATHLKEFGWEYIVVDIRWYVDNQTTGHYNDFNSSVFIYDEYGRYLPSPSRFPSSAGGAGFKPLSDYVHSKGLKFGIHIMRGVPKKAVSNELPVKGTSVTAADIYSTNTLCTWLFDNYTIEAEKEGAQEYYNSIFELYASWGVDYVKVDDLSRPYHSDEIEMIRKAIDNSGRPIVLSMSPGATPLDMHEHARNNANLWRTVDDLWDNWAQLSEEFSVCADWAPYISPGAWPDADMLPLGKFIRGERATDRYTNFSRDESYTLMTLWSIFKSPLMFGGNLPDNNAFTDSIITNIEVLDMHKRSVDNLQWFSENSLTTWTANDPENGDKFLALFNTPDREVNANSAIANSGLISRNNQEEGVNIEADIAGATKLYLVVTDAGDNFNYDHGDWINPALYKDNGDYLLLNNLNWVSATSGWATVQINRSLDGNPLRVNGQTYANGFGVNSYSIIEFDIPQDGYSTFKSLCGFDDEVINAPNGVSIEFLVYTENPTVFDLAEVEVNLKEIGFDGTYTVRDMWKQSDMGSFSDSLLSTSINFHGARLFRISAMNRSENTTVSLSATSTEISTCDEATFTISVAKIDENPDDLTGWVQIFSNNSLIDNIKVNASGEAEFILPPLTIGDHSFRASYGGNTWFSPREASDSITVHVNKGQQNIYEDIVLCEDELPFVYYRDTIHPGTSSGSYEFNYPSNQGCDYTFFLNLTVNPSYHTELFDTICRGESVEIQGAEFTMTGLYSIPLSTVLGCDSTVTLDLTVHPKHFRILNESICKGDVLMVGEQSFADSGLYNVTLENQYGCDSVLRLSLNVLPVPEVFIGNDTSISEDQEIILDAGDGYSSYHWSTGDSTQQILLSGLNEGEYTYSVVVSAGNECNNSDSLILTVTIADAAKLFVSRNISIYPNPTNEFIYLESDYGIAAPQVVSIYNESGILIMEKEYERLNAGDLLKLDISKLKTGIYFLRLNDSESITIHKVLKE